MYKEAIKTAGAKMDKTIEIIEKDLSTLRAGRANPQILDKITVDYYGTPTHLNQVGNISSPELNEERRKELCKQVKKQIEEGKVAIRNTRRDTMDQIKKMKNDSAITEDDLKQAETEMQKVTDAHIKTLDKVGADKEKEIMSI